MNRDSKNYIIQYKFLFYLSWIFLYFIFPTWHSSQIYISFTDEIIDLTISPKILLLIYFFISACFLKLFFKPLSIDTPLIIYPDNWTKPVKDHLWLVLACCVAAALHLFTVSPMHIISPHTYTDRTASWIYSFTTDHWNSRFNFPVQYMIWSSIAFLAIILKQKKLVNLISDELEAFCSLYRSNHFVKLLFITCIVSVFFVYTKLLPYYSWQNHLFLTGEAPLGTLLYLIPYYLFGIKLPYLGPAIIQFTFYILSTVFLYKTILLFLEKHAALLGASIYLFSPIVFGYATLSHLASGVLFFMIIVSYFFLKFIKDGEDHDLILTAFFISIGSLYKREIILMLIICSIFLVAARIKQKDLRLFTSLKVLSLAAISFLPWYFMGTRGADNAAWSHLTEIKGLSSYASMLLSQISWPVFSLFLISLIYALIYKRNKLTSFFGMVFISYYVLYTSLKQQEVHRYAMALYPAISVFLAQFICAFLQKIKWKHAYKLVFTVLMIYLGLLCIVPRSSTKLITFKYTDFENQSFPDDKAREWIRNELGNNEKVLILVRMSNDPLIKGKEHFRRISQLSQLLPSDDYDAFRDNLKALYKKMKITHIMFPGGDAVQQYPKKEYRELEIRKFLEEDKYDDFIVAAKFNIDDNYIYIYKLRDNFNE